MVPRPLHVVLALGLVAALSPLATAQERSLADSHLRHGLAFYEQNRYERAIAEFEAGFRADPRPEFLYALGQAERRSGDCASAMIYYRRFLATNPGARQARAARLNLDRCRMALSSGPGGEPAPPPTSQWSPRPVDPAGLDPGAGRRTSSPWYHDAATGVLLGASVTAAAVGGGLLVAARASRDRGETAGDATSRRVHTDHAERRHLWGVIALAASGALLGGAVLRAVTRDNGGPEQDGLAITPRHDGLTVTFAGSF